MFVTFEGPEGAGKSTLIKGLAAALQAEGEDVLVTREPGAGEVGAKVRQILLEGGDLNPRAELFLFLADRAQHVAGIIKPALEAGKLVLCDRHADSTIVYQGYGRGLNLDDLRSWNAFATDGLRPALSFLLDLDPAVGLSRLQSKDRMDAQPLEFHVKVRNGFLAEAAREPERWVILDATADPQDVLARAASIIRDRRPSLR